MRGDDIATAIRDCFISPNVSDSNWEAANLVDTMDRLATKVGFLCSAFSAVNDGKETDDVSVSAALCRIADSISSLAEAISNGR